MGMKMAMRSDLYAGPNDRRQQKIGVIYPNDRALIDDGIGTDLHSFADLSGGVDDCGGMDSCKAG